MRDGGGEREGPESFTKVKISELCPETEILENLVHVLP